MRRWVVRCGVCGVPVGALTRLGMLVRINRHLNREHKAEWEKVVHGGLSPTELTRPIDNKEEK